MWAECRSDLSGDWSEYLRKIALGDGSCRRPGGGIKVRKDNECLSDYINFINGRS